MKKWQIVVVVFLVFTPPLAWMIYRGLKTIDQPEDLAGETKPILPEK